MLGSPIACRPVYDRVLQYGALVCGAEQVAMRRRVRVSFAHYPLNVHLMCRPGH